LVGGKLPMNDSSFMVSPVFGAAVGLAVLHFVLILWISRKRSVQAIEGMRVYRGALWIRIMAFISMAIFITGYSLPWLDDSQPPLTRDQSIIFLSIIAFNIIALLMLFTARIELSRDSIYEYYFPGFSARTRFENIRSVHIARHYLVVTLKNGKTSAIACIFQKMDEIYSTISEELRRRNTTYIRS
jgi:hypothetical protein